MSYLIYKLSESGGVRMYVTDIPDEDNPIGGVGYQSHKDVSVPHCAGTAPTEEDAKKVCEWLRTAFYGASEDHFYELSTS